MTRHGGPGTPPAAVWGLVGLQLLLGIGWSLLAPIYRAPDEPQHMDLVLHVARGAPYPGAFDRQVGTQVTRSAERANLSFEGDPMPERGQRFTSEEAPARTQRPSFAAFGPDRSTELVNQMPQHGPLYYLLAGAATGALPSATSWDVQVWLVRVLSAALVAPLPLLAWWTARVVVGDRRAALAAAALPVAIPQLAHVAGAVSNDSLLILAFGIATAALAHVLVGDLRLRTALVVGAAAGAALLTKGFALALYGVIPIAYVLGARHHGRTRLAERARAAAPGAALSLAVATAVGGWWWIRNVVRYGTPQPYPFPYGDLPAEPVVDLGFWVPYFTSRMALRFWGQLGWVEVALPWPLVWGLSFALLGLMGAALLLRRAPVSSRRPELLGLLAPLAGLGAIVVYGALTQYLETGIPAGTQGRYLFPAVTGMAAVAGAGAMALWGRRGWLVPVAVVGVALALQCFAGLRALEHWYGPEGGGVALAARAAAAWAPVPPTGLLVVAVLLALTGVGSVVAVALETARAPSAHPEERRL
jgi:small subunit ribosomal protein S36